MRQIQVWESSDGFRWRFISLVGRQITESGRAFATEGEAVDAAYRFRSAVTVAPVKNVSGEIMPGPLVVERVDVSGGSADQGGETHEDY